MKRLRKIKKFIRKTIWTGKFLYKVTKLIFGLIRDLSEHANKQPDQMAKQTNQVEDKKVEELKIELLKDLKVLHTKFEDKNIPVTIETLRRKNSFNMKTNLDPITLENLYKKAFKKLEEENLIQIKESGEIKITQKGENRI